MNKSELIDTIASSSGVSKADTLRVLDGFIAAVGDELSAGGQVVLPGFGSFSVGQRAARTGRNPQTGELIQIKESTVAKFKAGKSLKEAVQK